MPQRIPPHNGASERHSPRVCTRCCAPTHPARDSVALGPRLLAALHALLCTPRGPRPHQPLTRPQHGSAAARTHAHCVHCALGRAIMAASLLKRDGAGCQVRRRDTTSCASGRAAFAAGVPAGTSASFSWLSSQSAESAESQSAVCNIRHAMAAAAASAVVGYGRGGGGARQHHHHASEVLLGALLARPAGAWPLPPAAASCTCRPPPAHQPPASWRSAGPAAPPFSNSTRRKRTSAGSSGAVRRPQISSRRQPPLRQSSRWRAGRSHRSGAAAATARAATRNNQPNRKAARPCVPTSRRTPAVQPPVLRARCVRIGAAPTQN